MNDPDTAAEFARFTAAHPEVARFDGFAFDLNGHARGKRYTTRGAQAVFLSGTQMSNSNFLLDATGAVTDAGGHGYSDGDPDGSARVVPCSLAIVPWARRPTAQFQLSMLPGQPGLPDLDPRLVAGRAVEALAALGLTAVAAFEIEFYLVRPRLAADGRPLPPRAPLSGAREEQPQVYSMELLADFEPVLDDVLAAAEAQGLPVAVASTEYGRGQFEANLSHDADALAACDRCLLMRRLIRGVAARHGLKATFMAKPWIADAGSGMHLNLSLLDGAGHNVFHAADGPPPMLRHAIAGMLAALPESMAILAPNRNAFRRFVPGTFVPVAANWGIANRSTALRVIPGGPAAQRIEHRVASADANPYLVLAAVLAGIVHGIEGKLEPPPAATGNAGTVPDPELPLGIDPALARLERATILPRLIDPAWLELYAETRRRELARLRRDIPPIEYRWYL